jgi:hypothetical protein
MQLILILIHYTYKYIVASLITFMNSKKKIYPRERPWRLIAVIPVRYEHHVHIEK